MTDEKKVQGIYPAGATHWGGDRFEVRTLFPSAELNQELDPFLLLDYVGPTQIRPDDAHLGAGQHPHRGFEIVTIVYQGMLQYRDSHGNAGTVGPEDVQWMTAGSGLVHEERLDGEFARQGGILELVQLWINLPKASKMIDPSYQSLMKEQIPVTTLGPAGYMRVVAGDMSGVDGPARTSSEVTIVDLRLNAGRETELCVCSGQTAALILLKGLVIVNGASTLQGEAVVALLEREGSMLTLKAQEDSTILIISGDPIGEPVERRGTFVMNTPEELAQAEEDFKAGRLGHL